MTTQKLTWTHACQLLVSAIYFLNVIRSDTFSSSNGHVTDGDASEHKLRIPGVSNENIQHRSLASARAPQREVLSTSSKREESRSTSVDGRDTWRGEDSHEKPDPSMIHYQQHSLRPSSSGDGDGVVLVGQKGGDWNKTLDTAISIPEGPEARADEHEANAAAAASWDDMRMESGEGAHLTITQT